jgi:hypothetical protein
MAIEQTQVDEALDMLRDRQIEYARLPDSERKQVTMEILRMGAALVEMVRDGETEISEAVGIICEAFDLAGIPYKLVKR